MLELNLNVRVRDKGGKGFARLLRRKGFIPAVYYGEGVPEALPLSVQKKELEDLLRTKAVRQSIITLQAERTKQIDGNKAMLKDWQIHPLTRSLIHVDLIRIDENKPITLQVPLVFQGKPKGLAFGGMLQTVRRELTISCLPAAIPAHIDVDISGLNVGESLHISNLKIAEGIHVVDAAEDVVATITHIAAAEETAAPAAAEAPKAEAKAAPKKEGK